MFPHFVTLYNKYIDAGVEKWHRTVLPGVFWDSSKGAIIRKTGVTTADGLRLLIPMSVAPGYVKPKEWDALKTIEDPEDEEATINEREGKWTLQNGDILVFGEIAYEVLKSSKELQQFDDVLTITNVDARYYGIGMSHWEVIGR